MLAKERTVWYNNTEKNVGVFTIILNSPKQTFYS